MLTLAGTEKKPGNVASERPPTAPVCEKFVSDSVSVSESGSAIDRLRLVEDDEQDFVYIVQIAFLPEYHAKGLGTALTGALMQEWAARGRGSRAKVMMNNEPSLRMFRKLGFVETGAAEGGYIQMVAAVKS